MGFGHNTFTSSSYTQKQSKDMERPYFLKLLIHVQLLLLILSSTTISTTSRAVGAAAGEKPSLPSSVSSSSDDLIARFRQYLRINTSQPNPRYDEAADFIVSQAISIGLEHKILEFVKGKPVVLLTWPGQDPTLPSILLNSHVDVVPVEEDKWIYPPFDAYMDAEGNIFARGAQDMKSVGLQHLEAIRRLKSSGFRPLRTIYVSFVPDEEIGGEDGTELFVASDEFAAMNVAVVLDEGGPTPILVYGASNAERCAWWLSIKATGEAGHGSKLYDNSAMENLLKSLDSVWRFRASQFDLIKSGLKEEAEVTSVNLVYLKAGSQNEDGTFTMNSQPSEAEAGFDIRITPTADPDSLDKRIEEEWAPASRNMTYKFEQKTPVRDEFGRPIVTQTEGNPWWILFKETIESSYGPLLPPQIAYGSTDARYYRQRGISAFGFSPMPNTPMLLHAHNEFLNKDVYLNGIDVYASIIEAYSSYVELSGARKS